MGFFGVLIVAGVLFGLASLAKSKGVRWLQIVFGLLLFGFVGGSLTDWIFHSFSWGFWIGVIGVGLAMLGDSDSSSSYSGSSSSRASSDYSSSYSSGSSYSSSSSSNDRSSDRRQYEYMASDAYSRYQSYLADAERELSQADTELRYAEDYEYRAREYNDSSAASQASSCRSNARYNTSRAEDYRRKADYYYGLYEEYKDKARSC